MARRVEATEGAYVQTRGQYTGTSQEALHTACLSLLPPLTRDGPRKPVPSQVGSGTTSCCV